MNDVTEQELQAYVDGRLDAARRDEVEAYVCGFEHRFTGPELEAELASAGVEAVAERRVPACALDGTRESRVEGAPGKRTLIVGCAITSVTAPDIFAARALAKEWQDVRAGSHLYVRFPTPLRAERGGVEISEVVVGLGLIVAMARRPEQEAGGLSFLGS